MGTNWFRRVRGLAGLGLIGGAVWGLAAAGLTAISARAEWGTAPTLNVMVGAGFGAFLGASSTVGFGILLALTARGRRLDELSVVRSMLMCGAIAALVPVLLMTAVRGEVPAIDVLAQEIGIFGSFGALVGGSLVAVARRSDLLSPDTEAGSPDGEGPWEVDG